MSSKFQLAPLVEVQERRVEAAMNEVRARNEAVRQRESLRQAAYKRLEEAFKACQQERQAEYESLAERQGQTVAAAGLVRIDSRREWWIQRLGEYWREFQEAEQELSKAQAEAAQAQQAYRRALAREEALAKLEANWRTEQEVKSQRAEEQVVEDLLGSRFSSSRRGDA